MVKIGIISFAHMHAFSYAQAVKQTDGAILAGIYDEDKERGRSFSEQLGTEFFAGLEDFLHSGLDAVIVTSENAKHRDYVIAAAKAGKHVLCEKPLSTNLKDAQEMIDVCREQRVLLQTAFPVRFNPSIIRAKQLIDDGKVGRIIAIKGTNRGQNPGGWFIDPALSGGGAVIDHTVHVADIMRWFTGAEAKEVYAEIGHLISKTPIDDCGILSIEFDNGVFATLDCSWSRNKAFPTWGDVTLEIVGTEGTLSIDVFNQKLNVYSNDRGLRWDFWGNDMDLGLVHDFIDSVRTGKTQASVTGEDGMRAVEIALAAYQASEKKQPVTLR